MTRTLDPVNLAVLNGRLVGHAEPRVLGIVRCLFFDTMKARSCNEDF